MPTYNALINHSDAGALIPEGEVREIFKNVAETSQVFKLCRRLPNMSSNRTRLKVLDTLPVVYWQESSTALKQTTKAAWKDKYIYAEELAVIVPIAEADLKDAEFDVWGEIKPALVEAVAQKIDAAVFFGTEKPANFPDGIVPTAVTRGFTYPESANGLYKDLNETMGLVEESGYDVNGILGGPSIKKAFRGMTDTTGQLITNDEISALPRAIVKNGAWDSNIAKAVVGDFSQAVFSIREDMEYKVLDQAVIQDASGNIIYNLAQQDMVALRVTFRFGWQLPNPVNRLKGTEASRLPFAALVPAGE